MGELDSFFEQSEQLVQLPGTNSRQGRVVIHGGGNPDFSRDITQDEAGCYNATRELKKQYPNMRMFPTDEDSFIVVVPVSE